MLKQVHDCIGDVVSFITNAGNASTANKSNLLELLSNPTKITQLQMELIITVDVGDVFKATCNLEVDVLLALSTYEHISFLSTFATTVHYPHTADICT